MHVLVVCTANIARSPLAAAMLSSSLTPRGIEVTSAGTRARPGLPAAERSQRLAVERGLDLTSHRSRRVDGRVVADADLVLTMSERQRDTCAPAAGPRGTTVFTILELVRLVRAVELEDRPVDPADALRWLAEEAHLARPIASPPPSSEDVHDPIRDPWPAWVQMAETLDGYLGRIVAALGVPVGWDRPSSAADGHEAVNFRARRSDRRRRARPRRA